MSPVRVSMIRSMSIDGIDANSCLDDSTDRSREAFIATGKSPDTSMSVGGHSHAKKHLLFQAELKSRSTFLT
jgi:hypothetical protein